MSFNNSNPQKKGLAMSNSKPSTCRACRHFDRRAKLCRINPPVSGQVGSRAIWPTVDADFDWCSRREPRESAPEV